MQAKRLDWILFSASLVWSTGQGFQAVTLPWLRWKHHVLLFSCIAGLVFGLCVCVCGGAKRSFQTSPLQTSPFKQVSFTLQTPLQTSPLYPSNKSRSNQPPQTPGENEANSSNHSIMFLKLGWKVEKVPVSLSSDLETRGPWAKRAVNCAEPRSRLGSFAYKNSSHVKVS